MKVGIGIVEIPILVDPFWQASFVVNVAAAAIVVDAVYGFVVVGIVVVVAVVAAAAI